MTEPNETTHQRFEVWVERTPDDRSPAYHTMTYPCGVSGQVTFYWLRDRGMLPDPPPEPFKFGDMVRYCDNPDSLGVVISVDGPAPCHIEVAWTARPHTAMYAPENLVRYVPEDDNDD